MSTPLSYSFACPVNMHMLDEGVKMKSVLLSFSSEVWIEEEPATLHDHNRVSVLHSGNLRTSAIFILLELNVSCEVFGCLRWVVLDLHISVCEKAHPGSCSSTL